MALRIKVNPQALAAMQAIAADYQVPVISGNGE